MTKHLKKTLALLLVIVLCLGTIPFPAFAVGVLPDDDFSSEVIIEPEEPGIVSSPEPESSSSPRGSPRYAFKTIRSSPITCIKEGFSYAIRAKK